MYLMSPSLPPCSNLASPYSGDVHRFAGPCSGPPVPSLLGNSVGQQSRGKPGISGAEQIARAAYLRGCSRPPRCGEPAFTELPLKREFRTAREGAPDGNPDWL